MAAAFKTCPICMTPNSRLAERCQQCGSDLGEVLPHEDPASTSEPHYAFERGETDLLESSVAGSTMVRVLGVILFTMLAGFIALLVAGVADWMSRMSWERETIVSTETPLPIALATVTPSRPTATHTPWPSQTPLPTLTPTPAPCIQIVQEGDTLIALVSRCGHRHRDILARVVERNGLISAEQLQIGQEIIIPWPTAVPESGELPGGAHVASALVLPTSTLPAGVMWHPVSSAEDIVSIAARYGADIEILSQLNPELTFSQCDFGLAYGGENCFVAIYVGQQVRVPAPTAIPSATAPPVWVETTRDTAAQDAVPHDLRPGDGVVYRADEIVTLRWLSRGTLGADQSYVVEIIDETSALSYLAETREQHFRIPNLWQAKDGQRHLYRWRVGLRRGSSGAAMFWTEAHTFVWLGRQAET